MANALTWMVFWKEVCMGSVDIFMSMTKRLSILIHSIIRTSTIALTFVEWSKCIFNVISGHHKISVARLHLTIHKISNTLDGEQDTILQISLEIKQV